MNFSLGPGARKELSWTAVAIVSLILIGWMVGNLTATLLAGSLIYLGWHLTNLFQLAFWLQKKNNSPACPGHLERCPFTDSTKATHHQ